MSDSRGGSSSQFLSVAGLLVFGTTVSICHKAVYELETVGLNGPAHFEKPWALMTVMFLGMSLCLPVAFFKEYKKVCVGQDGQPSLGKIFNSGELEIAKLLAIPALFDVGATILMNVGLLSVTASVYQMLRGAMLFFAAFFGVRFLKRHLNQKHKAGIALALLGMLVVGAASLMSGEGSTNKDLSQSDILSGMGLIVASQALQAAQVTFEDLYMTQHNIDPLKVVGYEGLFGSFITLVLLLPLASAIPPDVSGFYENTFDTLEMVGNSPLIAGLLVLNLVSYCGLNLSGMRVTAELGGVFRTFMETMRTLLIWLVGLALFYSPYGPPLGESWHDYSYLQLAGFGILMVGMLFYAMGNQQSSEPSPGLEEPMLAESLAPVCVDAPGVSGAGEWEGGSEWGSIKPVLGEEVDFQRRQQLQQVNGLGGRTTAAVVDRMGESLEELAVVGGGQNGNWAVPGEVAVQGRYTSLEQVVTSNSGLDVGVGQDFGRAGPYDGAGLWQDSALQPPSTVHSSDMGSFDFKRPLGQDAQVLAGGRVPLDSSGVAVVVAPLADTVRLLSPLVSDDVIRSMSSDDMAPGDWAALAADDAFSQGTSEELLPSAFPSRLSSDLELSLGERPRLQGSYSRDAATRRALPEGMLRRCRLRRGLGGGRIGVVGVPAMQAFKQQVGRNICRSCR